MLNLSFVNNNPPALNGTNMNAIVSAINSLESQLASPFNFKGTVTATTDLPPSGNTVNDTYYVSDDYCLYSWDGTLWSQSSLNETDYLAQISDIETELNAILTVPNISWDIGKGINSSGVISNSSYNALTDIFPVQEGDIVINNTPAKDDNNVSFVMYAALYSTTAKLNDTFVERRGFVSVRTLVIPTGITGMRILFGRLTSSGVTFANEDLGYWSAQYFLKPSSYTLDLAVYANRDKSTNELAVPVRFTGSYSGWTSLADMPDNSYVYFNVGTSLQPLLAPDTSFIWNVGVASYIAEKTKLTQSGAEWYHIHRISGKDEYVGYKNTSDTEITWNKTDAGYVSQDEVKILFVGNSFTQDSTVYAPYVVNSLTDKVRLTVGISYYGGASIDDYIGFFNNDDQVLEYDLKQPTSTAWTISSNKTIKEILSDQKWDVIVINQKNTGNMAWSTYSNLSQLMDDFISFCYSTNNYAVRIGWLAPQIYYVSGGTYQNAMDCAEKVIENTVADFVIPCGTAIQNARQTSLNSLGDAGGLTSDGQHLQEGLPVLLSSYVTALKILELCGIGYRSVLGSSLAPTQTWVTDRNIPGQNGTVISSSASNLLIAQKCAVAAIKNPYEVTAIS